MDFFITVSRDSEFVITIRGSELLITLSRGSEFVITMNKFFVSIEIRRELAL